MFNTPWFKSISILTLLVAPLVPTDGPALAATVREPAFPLKTARRLYSEATLRQAHDNIREFPTAKAIAEGEIANASKWLSWSDEELLAAVPDSSVPRAFNVGTEGCPACGKKIYEKGGTYPWIIDPKHPFKVTCPVDGTTYPDNDFEAYYRSGRQDKEHLEGKYSDDGWGWVGPTGHRFWFVAYANHWSLYSHVIPAVRSLARAYLLTRNPVYAHKAAVLLHRIAEVYPDMDHHSQSRYGQMQQALGIRYEGKIVNAIWETGVLYMLAESYDCVWDSLDGDESLQTLLGKSGEQIRAFIEANLLEEGIDSVAAGKIRGNYGMHQRALTYAALARDGGPVEEWLGSIIHTPSDRSLYLGLDYALYDLIYRDGIPYETAPGYNFSWVRNITEVGETLHKAGLDLYSYPRMKRLYDGVLDLVAIGKHTPALGDSGSVYGGIVGQDAFTFQAAYRAYQDPRHLAFLGKMGVTGEKSFSEFESLFFPPIPASETTQPSPSRSRLLDGYGMGFLNNAGDTVAASLYYGYTGGHGHFDRLHFDLYACGWPMMPDLGYPDFMNAYVPGIYTWSKNTIAHNTVVVDEKRQPGNVAGEVTAFVDTPIARLIEVDAAGTYPQCSEYRRTLLMVDIDSDSAYWVDCFTVIGGTSHHYSLHGPPGEFELVGGEWTEPAHGTLAGATVEVGALYDDPVRSASGFAGAYYGYAGSGFQHLTQVQRLKEGDWMAHWRHEKDPNAQLRIWIPPQEGTEILTAQAQVSPINHTQPIQFLIAHREGEDLQSTFVSVIEAGSGESQIERVRWSSGNAVGKSLDIRLRNGAWDRVVWASRSVHDTSKTEEAMAGEPFFFGRRVGNDSPAALLLLDPDNRIPPRLASSLGEAAKLPPFAGEVIAVAPASAEVRIALKDPPEFFSGEDLLGRVVHFQNDLRRTSYTVTAATLESNVLVLETDADPLVGRARLGSIEGGKIRSEVPFQFGPTYRGRYLSDLGFSAFHRIEKVDDSTLELSDSVGSTSSLVVGEDAWVVDIAPGDRFTAPAVYWRESGR